MKRVLNNPKILAVIIVVLNTLIILRNLLSNIQNFVYLVPYFLLVLYFIIVLLRKKSVNLLLMAGLITMVLSYVIMVNNSPGLGSLFNNLQDSSIDMYHKTLYFSSYTSTLSIFVWIIISVYALLLLKRRKFNIKILANIIILIIILFAIIEIGTYLFLGLMPGYIFELDYILLFMIGIRYLAIFILIRYLYLYGKSLKERGKI